MEDAACVNFFSHPTQTYHRQYEALRAVFVDGRSQKDVADEFGFEYSSFRQLVSQFRRDRDSAEPSDESPFFETFPLGDRQKIPTKLWNLQKRIVSN